MVTGSIIRCMRRLEELLRQMVQAAKAIGNTELENKFSEGMQQNNFCGNIYMVDVSYLVSASVENALSIFGKKSVCSKR